MRADTYVSVRVTYAEKDLLALSAARRGLTVSEFVRRAVLLDAAVVDLVHSGGVRPLAVGCGEAPAASGSVVGKAA